MTVSVVDDADRSSPPTSRRGRPLEVVGVTVAVVQFGGSNCDRDAVRALEHVGVDAGRVWHEDGLPADTEGSSSPAGSPTATTSAPARWPLAPIMAEVREAAADGVPVIGVCNGAQIGSGPGSPRRAFTTNASARFQCEPVHLRVERADTPGPPPTTRAT